ncbi:hypothetical protein NB037_03105 [Rathayibacter sp. ZW T2_19]|uniref:HK97 gp10 family phage protein n=1 Tax=Rathayibacter rubneri TaxID=2950106 RepID=A0A9X2IRE4_9MICO|nr:hypothetical protein [Rathayibacter rubneri]MCM6761396.1 hypothetical protein [Rathayibacter rubneri]
MGYYRPVLSLIEKAAQDALLEVAEAVIENSNARAPRLTGETEDTSFARVDDLTAQAGYESFVARLQHEDLEYEHPRGGEPKFLEKAAEDVRPKVGPMIEKHIREALGG